MPQDTINPGLIFYKEYFRKYNYNSNELKFSNVEKNNKLLLDYQFPAELSNHFVQKTDNSFELKTVYPGLLCGSGYIHDLTEEEAFKIGFFFDYTTGLPIIPGPSVKGLIRSAFPGDTKTKYRKEKTEYIKEKFEKIGIKLTETDDKLLELILKLEYEIFEGASEIKENGKPEILKTNTIYKRDIFFDAYVSKANSKNLIFGEDTICPHGNDPLKNPTPLNFLKVLPEVTFSFNFDLKDSKVIPELKSDKKLLLFKEILLDFGIGAKTNVGYGQFEKEQEKKQFNSGEEISAKLSEIDYHNNRIYFKIDGNPNELSIQVARKKLNRYSVGKKYTLIVRNVNEDGSIKSISLK